MSMERCSENPGKAAPGPVVVKVGGSLLTWPELPARLTRFLAHFTGCDWCSNEEIVLIAGGGPAADVVRNMDQIHGLGNLRAHRLALSALDLTAELLAALVPGSGVVHRPEAFRSIWNLGKIPIVSPASFLEEYDDRELDPLPANWNVTSDSIAARIATHLKSRCLFLLKSKSLPPKTSLSEAASLGLVDPMFPAIARNLDLVVSVCLRDFEPLPQVLYSDLHQQEPPPSSAS
jgi:5-(aminomethyl)-3-furanmethanol phosphate kinase